MPSTLATTPESSLRRVLPFGRRLTVRLTAWNSDQRWARSEVVIAPAAARRVSSLDTVRFFAAPCAAAGRDEQQANENATCNSP